MVGHQISIMKDDSDQMQRIGIIANEASGDLLGAELIKAIRHQQPNTIFYGVAGPRMQAQGCHSFVAMEQLSVMGLIEVLAHLPRLWQIRQQLLTQFLNDPPHVLITIDAPDFNLPLAATLHRTGIKTIHYVSPSVWAWRPNRVKQIRTAVDCLLTLFPFEQDFLQRHRVPACYVGHPLADQIPLHTEQHAARQVFGLTQAKPIIAILPGSRRSEVQRLAKPFLETAQRLVSIYPQIAFIIPVVNQQLQQLFSQAIGQWGTGLPLTLLQQQSHQAMQAADLVLTASGTATLEALLFHRPMVVGYRLHPLTYSILNNLKLVKTPSVVLANLLADEPLAPEFLQHHCQPEQLATAIRHLLEDTLLQQRIQQHYQQIHQQLRCNASERAAAAVLRILADQHCST